MSNTELIKRLCAAYGPSGLEANVADVIRRELEGAGAEIKSDRMGNLIVPMHFGDRLAHDRKRIMVSAHMDEVGFMITEIKKEGYLGFDTVGGISDSVMAGRRVKVLCENEMLDGVIASKAIHHKDRKERQKPTKIDKLYIDIGAKDADEASALVRVGDFAAFESEAYEFGDGLIKARALDDRMGCAAMIESIYSLVRSPAENNIDVYFCFTVREEIGLSGARIAAFEIRPDIAIVLETTAVGDIADSPDSKKVARLGEGVCVSLMDRSTIYDRELIDRALKVAKEKGIAAQVKKYVSGGNDAGSIHKTAEGVRTVALSVPTRYLHSASCVASLKDYESQKSLCEQLIRTYFSFEKEK